MIDLYDRGRKKYDWWFDWRGECVAVVAGGPSLRNLDVSVLRNRIHVVVVNESHKLCPWAEILYSCDANWWRLRQVEAEKFRGLKIGFEAAINLPFVKNISIKRLGQHDWVNQLLLTEPGQIGSGGNSGFQLTNLVVQMGATGVALIGVDCNVAGGVHWHGKHPDQLRNPEDGIVGIWKRNFEAAAIEFKRVGVDVVNCSPTSALESYPKITIEQMLERWGL